MGVSFILLIKLYMYSTCRAFCNNAMKQLFKITLLYGTAQKMSKVLQPLFLYASEAIL